MLALSCRTTPAENSQGGLKHGSILSGNFLLPRVNSQWKSRYYFPGDLDANVGAFVEHYNHRRYRRSLNNLTPANVYVGRVQAIIMQLERIKRMTIKK